MKYSSMGNAPHQRPHMQRQLYTVTQIVDWFISRDKLKIVLLFILFFTPLLAEADMNNDIAVRIEKANNILHSFIIDPGSNENNYLLGKVLDDINDIDINNSQTLGANYNKYRLSLLMLHLKVLQEFDKHYIPSYKPQKNYVLNLMPPPGAIEGPILGTVDPAEIKDEDLRKAYEQDLIDNKNLGKEIAFQSELSALKLKLSLYDNKLGVISDSAQFIQEHYTNSANDKREVERTVNNLFYDSPRAKELFKSVYEIKKE